MKPKNQSIADEVRTHKPEFITVLCVLAAILCYLIFSYGTEPRGHYIPEVAQAQREQKIRQQQAACSAIYGLTINERISNLTIRQTELIRQCKSLDMYTPE